MPADPDAAGSGADSGASADDEDADSLRRRYILRSAAFEAVKKAALQNQVVNVARQDNDGSEDDPSQLTGQKTCLAGKCIDAKNPMQNINLKDPASSFSDPESAGDVQLTANTENSAPAPLGDIGAVSQAVNTVEAFGKTQVPNTPLTHPENPNIHNDE